jgi:hypothetical protein
MLHFIFSLFPYPGLCLCLEVGLGYSDPSFA